MSYGGRYVRMAAGDPGLFSGLGKLVGKVVAPVAKVAGIASKIPVLGPVLRAVPGVGTAMAVMDVGRSALGAARTALGGSKVIKGPLMLGGKNLLPSRPGVGPVMLAGGGTALGAAAGVAVSRRASTQTQPSRRRRSRGRTRVGARGRCGCPPGKKRVCFGRGRRPKGDAYAREARSQGLVTAKQAAARRRFAAAARRGPIRKGARL